MFSLLIISRGNQEVNELQLNLSRNGFDCQVIADDRGGIERISRQPPDVVLLEIAGNPDDFRITELISRITPSRDLPIIALITRQAIDKINRHLDVDDFVIAPYDTEELTLRIKQLLHKTGNRENRQLLKCDDLILDEASCEVTLEGRPVELTFREYQLLRFLASNRGRVFSREVLLDRVWGYDYYGGDRTVDVHIRRLRSKIEDSKHCFIETVRNIGYRFKKKDE